MKKLCYIDLSQNEKKKDERIIYRGKKYYNVYLFWGYNTFIVKTTKILTIIYNKHILVKMLLKLNNILMTLTVSCIMSIITINNS